MPGRFSNSVAVRFIDREKVLSQLRQAVAEAKAQRPEIALVFLFGSLVTGDWTADSDADLIVIVRREFPGVLDRSIYQIHTPAIHTDTLVYSEAEFDALRQDPSSFLARNLAAALEL